MPSSEIQETKTIVKTTRPLSGTVNVGKFQDSGDYLPNCQPCSGLISFK